MENIILIGSEDVQRAGNNMRQAADDMQRAAGTISEALIRHEQFLENWAARLEAVMKGEV